MGWQLITGCIFKQNLPLYIPEGTDCAQSHPAVRGGAARSRMIQDNSRVLEMISGHWDHTVKSQDKTNKKTPDNEAK